MEIMTDIFGMLTYEETDVLTFSEGLYGFETAKEFILIQIPETPYWSLQSIDVEDLAFTVTTPFAFYTEYDFEISEQVVKQLCLDSLNDMEIYNIIVLRDPLVESTFNLKAPLVINTEKRIAKQVILNEDFPLKFQFLLNVEE